MFGGGGQQYVFNLGGGPGFRVHQFGGGRPRRRPREANGDRDESPQTLLSIFTNLLPLLILFVLPFLSSLLASGTSEPVYPEFRYKATPPYSVQRKTQKWGVNYYLNPKDILDYSTQKFNRLDQKVEVSYINTLRYECQSERQTKARMMNEAQGWFFQDPDKIREARNLAMTSCNRLTDMRLPLQEYY